MTTTARSELRRAEPQLAWLAENCWMVSSRNPAALLQCNTYLRIFSGPRHGTSLCIDPGSNFDWQA